MISTHTTRRTSGRAADENAVSPEPRPMTAMSRGAG